MATNTGFVITDLGNAVATVTTPAGPFVHITEFRVSDAYNWVPDGTETALPGTILYTGGIANYYVVAYDTIELILFMDATVGPFNFGTVGIYLADGTLYATCAWDTIQEKIRAVGNQAGTQWRIRARLKFSRASVVCQVDVITSTAILEVSNWEFLVTPVNQVGNSNMAIVLEQTPHRDSVLVYKTDENTWALNDFTEVFRGSTDDAGCSIGTSSITHPNIAYGYFTLPQINSRYLVKFPDGDIRRVTDIIGDDELTFAPAKAIELFGEFSIWEESQSACCRARWADRVEYNAFVNDFNPLWASPTGTYSADNEGLNQAALPLLTAPSHPGLLQWTNLQNAVISKCKIHGVSHDEIIFTDYAYCCDDNPNGFGLKTLSDSFNSLLAVIDPLVAARNTADVVYQESTIPETGTATREEAWSGTKTHILTLTYTDANTFKGLVNGGHQLMLNAEVETGATANWLALKGFLVAIGTVTISRGATVSSGDGTDSAIGLYQLTGVDQVLFVHSDTIVGGPVEYEVKGKITGGNVVTITIEILNTASGLYGGEAADLFTSQLAMRKPQSEIISTPVLEYPVVVTTGDLGITIVPPTPVGDPITLINVAMVQNTTTSTELVLNKPVDTVENDVMFAIMGAKTNAEGTWTDEAGWTSMVALNDGPMLHLAYKVAGPGEPSTYEFTSSVTRLLAGIVLTYRNAIYDTVGALGHATSGGAITVQGITPDVDAVVFMAVMDQSGSVTVPNITGWTQVVGAVNSGPTGPSYRVFRKDGQSDGTATGTVSVDTSATSGESAAVMFSLKQ